MYYVFNTETEALQTLEALEDNIREAIRQVDPNALTSEGYLKGTNAQTGLLDETVLTTAWDVPRQRLDGKWVFKKPLVGDLLPLDSEGITASIVALEETYSDEWFPVDQYLEN